MRLENALCFYIGVCATLLASTVSAVTATSSCDPDKLTVYKVVMHTFWTRQLFPKHYPEWRPPAQWSKLIGRSHNPKYSLFRVGTHATPGVKEFAETGQSGILDMESQGGSGIFDMFTGPPTYQGAGRAEAQLFLDGNHSRVSLMARIVPSPDWFIGIDSFELCVESNWLDSITIEVDPMDAGTDNGFTFTAPNWATEPQGVIYRITSQYPPHPAGSFYYPYLKRLPPIATFQFIKLREYELNEVFHHSEDDKRYDLMRADQKNVLVNNHDNNHNNDIQLEIEAQRREQEIRLQLIQQQLLTTRLSPAPTTLVSTAGSTSMQQQQSHSAGAGIIPRGDKDAILNSIVQTYHNQEPTKQRNKNKKVLRKFKGARDCRVGDWGTWSVCSVSCGIGEVTRHRTVERHPRRGGKACPPLTQSKWCGAANDNCPSNSLNSNW